MMERRKKLDVVIRKAKWKDIPSLARLCEQNTLHHRRFSDLLLELNNETLKEQRKDLRKAVRDRNQNVLVAVNGGNIIGYMVASIRSKSPFLSYPRRGILEDAFVREEYRNMGLGSKLLDSLTDWFKSKKTKHIEVIVDSQNRKAFVFWEKRGFREVVKKMSLDF